MATRIFGAALAALIALSSTAKSQDACSNVLNGMYDFRLSQSVDERFRSFQTWMCSSEQFNTSGEASLPIQGLPAQFGGDLNWAKSQCGQSSEVVVQNRRFMDFVQAVNPHVVAAWERCMSRLGLNAGIIQTSDPSRFFVQLSYIPVDPSIPAATLDKGLDGIGLPAGVTCQGDWINSDERRVAQLRTLSCQRDNPKTDVSIPINGKPSPRAGANVLSLPGHTQCETVRENYSSTQLGLPNGKSLTVQCGAGSQFQCRHQNGSLDSIDWTAEGWTQQDRVTFAYKTYVAPDNYLGMSVNGTVVSRNGEPIGCKYNSLSLSCSQTVCQ